MKIIQIIRGKEVEDGCDIYGLSDDGSLYWLRPKENNKELWELVTTSNDVYQEKRTGFI